MSRYTVTYEPSREHTPDEGATVEVRAASPTLAAEEGALALTRRGVRLQGVFWLRVEDCASGHIERLLVRERVEGPESRPLTRKGV